MTAPPKTRVLVIDDEPQILRALRINLSVRGYQVSTAATGHDGLRAAAERKPDVVVLDLGLPDMPGIEVLEGLRGWLTAPVIVLSARSDSADKVEALDAGADDYVTKPFGMDEFLARLRAAVRRGATAAEDEAIVAAMLADPKSQAENRMIVDLLRNDISRVTEVGTLEVPKLFAIETYPTVHQMVSHVRAKLVPRTTLRDIFAALFPCGSVTGAPKMRAMEILHDLEAGPRDAYCGAIGLIAPDGTMQFNVAIRTLSLFQDGEAVFNVGGGIVFDSNAEAEYEECLLKARFAVGDQWISR